MTALKRSIILVLIFLGFTCPGGRAQGMDVAEILNRMDQVEKYKSVYAESTQVITTSDGEERTFKIKSWSVNTAEKQLMEYTYPARVKGVKILMLKEGDDIWSYSPRSRRIRHLASHAKKQKVMGSDFTYEDMAGGDAWKNDYTASRGDDSKADGEALYELVLTSAKDDNSYR